MTIDGADPAQGRACVDDEAAIRRLALDYAATADRGDGAAFAALFADGAVLAVPDYPRDLRPVVERTGPEALGLIPSALRRYDHTWHQMAGSELAFAAESEAEPTGGAAARPDASGTVDCIAHHLRRNGGPDDRTGVDTVWYIRYHDEYRRIGTEWKFTRRELHLRWVEERPAIVIA